MPIESNLKLIGSFPYAPGFNPYQSLITNAIEAAGNKVNRIPPFKWFPLQKAASSDCDLLHLDWPHDWYNGRNFALQTLKAAMYRGGLLSLRKKPVIWTAHNLVAHDSSNSKREQKLIQLLINECRGIMVMSDSARDELDQHYKVPSHTEVRKIYHGHYIDCYKNEVSREEARKRLNIDQKAFVYLAIGSIQPYKGHRDLIDSFSSTAKSEDILLIAGGGSQHFLKQIEDHASMQQSKTKGTIRLIPNFVPDNEFQYFFNAADVSVFPFRKVLNSGSVLLAMSFGNPIIAPKLGSIPEIVIPGHYFGYSSVENQLHHLANALQEAKNQISDLSNPTKTKKHLIDCIRRRYCWSKIGSELNSWYDNLI